VVCHGNICRSPFAAALLRSSLSQHGVRVASAGFLGPGQPAPPEAVAAATHYGVALSAHRSQLVTAESAHAAAVIVVMDPVQRRGICDRFGRSRRDVLVLGDFDPQPIATRAIPDPVKQSPDVFAEVYARIERCARELARAIGPQRC
jgi:protein-tyrosine phosphatase